MSTTDFTDKNNESLDHAQAEVKEVVVGRVAEFDRDVATLTRLESLGYMGTVEKTQSQPSSQEQPAAQNDKDVTHDAATVIGLAAEQETDQEAMQREARKLIESLPGSDDLGLAA